MKIYAVQYVCDDEESLNLDVYEDVKAAEADALKAAEESVEDMNEDAGEEIYKLEINNYDGLLQYSVMGWGEAFESWRTVELTLHQKAQ